MDAEKCAAAKAALNEAMGHLVSNNERFAAASPTLGIARAARGLLSAPDIAGLESSIKALEQELVSRRGGGDIAAGEAQVRAMQEQLANARADAERIEELDNEIAALEATIEDAQHQIEVQTGRINAAQTEIDLHCS